MNYKIHLFTLLLCIVCLIENAESRSVRYPIKSDVIVTNWPEDDTIVPQNETKQPGWMRRQLIRFGQVASKVGNAMGAHATKITSAIDKVCEVVKTVIPLLAAVCNVGQFKFCAATNEAPVQLSDALSPSNFDLNVPDK